MSSTRLDTLKEERAVFPIHTITSDVGPFSRQVYIDVPDPIILRVLAFGIRSPISFEPCWDLR